MRRGDEVVEADPVAARAWAAGGAMALTGWPDQPPLGPPAGMVAVLAGLGRRLGVDGVALLGERAALTGLTRAGRTSCGGATRLLPAGDGWVALSLARDDDRDLLPAWLDLAPASAAAADPWPAVASVVATRTVDELVAGAALLGLPVGGLGEVEAAGAADPVVRRSVDGPAPPPPASVEGLLVVDLSGLWAGPLCASLLGGLGATVVKVESTGRPDGARRGSAAFYDLLNGNKRSVALDLTGREGTQALQALVTSADVVVAAARPRALAGLGLDPEALLARGGPRVWVSITGHGGDEPGAHRVAFGDDAAVAGGLVAWDHRSGGPVFCADAVADPTTGLAAAAAVLDALAAGGRWLLDVALARVAAHLAGPTLPVPEGVTPSPPHARPVPGPARPLGADTDAVLASLVSREPTPGGALRDTGRCGVTNT